MMMIDLVRLAGPYTQKTKDGKPYQVWKVILLNRETGINFKVYNCLTYERASELTEDISYDRDIQSDIELNKLTA
ncbi:MAG TPA: hypothetical protein PLG63_05490 [bacterium]|jgi:hypothetical protein|nr:hypothetical protein [bacterium]HPM47202.1 hypothetical protein [bacterium]